MKANYLLSILSIILMFIVLEAGTRASLGTAFGPEFQTYLVYDQNRGWKLKPNFETEIKSVARNFIFDIKISPDGYRLDVKTEQQEKDSADIVILGDSNAFGFGLKSNETFTFQLNQTLAHSGVERTVLNAGVPGYDILQPIQLMKEMDIHEGMLFIFLVHPVNDLVNTANSRDYGAYKPFIYEEKGEIKTGRAKRHFEKFPYEFSRDFAQLNHFFSFPSSESTWLDILTDMSALVYTVRYWNHFVIYNSTTKLDNQIWDNVSKQKFIEQRLKSIKNKPEHFAARLWTELDEQKQNRERLIHYVGELYTNAQRYASSKGAQICIIIAPEAYRTTPFFIKQTNLVQNLLPNLNFNWGITSTKLSEELTKRKIPVITPVFSEKELNKNIFITLDDHKSAIAYKKISKVVSKYYISHIKNN